MIDVVVSSDAENDILDSASYYESKEKGLGSFFRSSILSDLTSLELLGGTHSLHNKLHRKLCKVFPYWIYYRMDTENALTVVAIVGQRRGHKYLMDRLSGG